MFESNKENEIDEIFDAERILIAFMDDDQRITTAQNSSDLICLMILAMSDDPEVRETVANNPASDEIILELLGSDDDLRVQSMVAGNPSTAPSTLERLATAADPAIRQKVAYHLNASPTVLALLASDTSVAVRRQAAANPFTAEGTLHKLSGDSDESVQRTATDSLSADWRNVDSRKWSEESAHPEEYLRSHLHLSNEMIRLLADDDDAAWRVIVEEQALDPDEVQLVYVMSKAVVQWWKDPLAIAKIGN